MRSGLHLLTAPLFAHALFARPASPEPGTTFSRQVHDISGWQVLFHDELPESGSADTAPALGLPKKRLDEIVRAVPAPAVAELREVPLHLSPACKPGHSGAEHHPGADRPRANRREPATTKGAESPGVRGFGAGTRRMPGFAPHEPARACHDRVLAGGFDDAGYEAVRVRAAMVESGSRPCIIAHDELTTDLPLRKWTEPEDHRDARVGGMDGSAEDPLWSFGEDVPAQGPLGRQRSRDGARVRLAGAVGGTALGNPEEGPVAKRSGGEDAGNVTKGTARWFRTPPSPGRDGLQVVQVIGIHQISTCDTNQSENAS